MLRIGCVPYLNGKPLVCGLKSSRTFRLDFRPPGVLVTMLRRGDLDVALIPAIELFDGHPYTVLSGFGIASAGPTDSVRLYHRTALRRVRRVALDQNSRTSNALTRVILGRKYGLRPSYTMYDPARPDGMARARADAAVVIGDLAFRPSSVPHLDLGSEWAEWTRLPFVYAVWAARPGLRRISEAADLLRRAKERGVKKIREIARRESKRMNLTPQFCLHYLTRCIYYDCGWKEFVGLLTFGRLAADLGLCSGAMNVDFA